MDKLIQFKNIVKSFDGQVVLRGINLDIYENEFVTLLGPSGCCLLSTSLEKTMEKNNTVMNRLKEADTENSVKKLQSVEEYQSLCGEVYRCL